MKNALILVRFAVKDDGVFHVSRWTSVLAKLFVVGMVVAQIFSSDCQKRFHAFYNFRIFTSEIFGLTDICFQIVET